MSSYTSWLARPVKAGPDGSSFFFANDDKKNDNHTTTNDNHTNENYSDNNSFINNEDIINWDDEEEDIHVQLETSLGSTIEDY